MPRRLFALICNPWEAAYVIGENCTWLSFVAFHHPRVLLVRHTRDFRTKIFVVYHRCPGCVLSQNQRLPYETRFSDEFQKVSCVSSREYAFMLCSRGIDRDSSSSNFNPILSQYRLHNPFSSLSLTDHPVDSLSTPARPPICPAAPRRLPQSLEIPYRSTRERDSPLQALP